MPAYQPKFIELEINQGLSDIGIDYLASNDKIQIVKKVDLAYTILFYYEFHFELVEFGYNLCKYGFAFQTKLW